MVAESEEFQFFEHLAKYSVAICRECRQGVLPSHIESHLQRVHRIKQKQAKHIAEKVRGWSGLTQYASEITVPSRLPESISQLPMYNDGLLCQLDPTRCCKVLRSADAMRKHWQRAHSWSVANNCGSPSRTV
jgi:hypothetical protein